MSELFRAYVDNGSPVILDRNGNNLIRAYKVARYNYWKYVVLNNFFIGLTISGVVGAIYLGIQGSVGYAFLSFIGFFVSIWLSDDSGDARSKQEKVLLEAERVLHNAKFELSERILSLNTVDLEGDILKKKEMWRFK